MGLGEPLKEHNERFDLDSKHIAQHYHSMIFN
jgi:hypothetical protein